MKKIYTYIMWLMLLCFATPAVAQLSELSGKYITAIGTQSSTLTTNQWYLLYNRGRGTYAYQRSDNMIYVKNSDLPVVGSRASDKSAFLIRFVNSGTSGRVYIQTGKGNYFSSLTQGNSNTSTTTQSTYYTYGTISSTSGHFYFNDASGMIMDANGPGDASLAGWNTGVVTSLNGNNDWALYPITLGSQPPATGEYVSSITSGAIYRIISKSYDIAMTEVTTTSTLKCMTTDATNYAQYWRVTADGSKYKIQNLLTGRYIQLQNGTYSQTYATGTSANTFTISKGSDSQSFTITDSGGVGLHCSTSQDDQVVGWYTSAEASVWKFQATNLTNEQIAEAQAIYSTYNDLKNNKSYVQSLLMNFFYDYSCTTLKSQYQQMSDASLINAMNQVGVTNPIFQEMILKVKNNSWQVYEQGWDKTEKTFRVADYKIYSDWDTWREIHKNSYCYSRLSNPTGISAKSGDLILVYVGSDTPSGATLQLEAVSGTSSTGSVTTLTKGVNAVLLSEDVNLFIYYTAEATTTSYPQLSNFPEIKIHIEGGRVNGYFDLTKGFDNNDWAKMQTHLLNESRAVNLKTDYILFNMNCELVKEACPQNMVGLLNIWDKILRSQRYLMGVDNHAPYFNNLLVAASITDSYMYASSYGTYYEESTLSSVMSYQMMNASTSIWGPAHENGHIHQNPINMIGCSEVSNNLFSNMAVYEQGRFTMRADEFSSIVTDFSNQVHWSERDLWEKCLMYTKLYYYYHVLGNNPDFFPNLFRALRNDPMDRRKDVTIRLKDESLKFYRYACDVAGEDLTEFFKVFGFFELTSNSGHSLGFYVDDYGSFYLDNNTTTVQADINASLQYVKNKNYPKNSNIIFIDDRIKSSLASYEGMPAGTIRSNYDNLHPIGRVGDVGQYGDYTPEYKCSGYKYNLYSRRVSIMGEGAVGYKVYDSNGELAYISNTSGFTIPERIFNSLGDNFIIVACEGNGEEIEVVNANKTYYTLNTYYGSEDMKVLYTYGEAPQMPDNTIAFISGSNKESAPTSLTRHTNIIDAYNQTVRLEIKDGVNFYSPIDFTALQLSYDKEAYSGEVVPVIFPFEIKPSGVNGSIYEFTGIEDDNVNFNILDDKVYANTPYLFKSNRYARIVPVSTNVTIKATPTTTMKVVKGVDEYEGTYKHTTQSHNFYAFRDGAFVRSGGDVEPFDVILRVNNGSIYNSYIPNFINTPTGVEEVEIEKPLFPADVYDIAGRLIRKNAISFEGLSNGVYIVNGKKFICNKQ